MTKDAKDILQGAGLSHPRFFPAVCLVSAVTALLMLYADVPAARFAAAHADSLPKYIQSLLDGARQFGQGFSVAAAVALMWTLDPKRRREALFLVAVIVATAVFANLLKMATSRARPNEFLDNGRMWLFFEGFKHSRFNSFPSAHAASAFALSAGLAVLYPRARGVFFAVAALCAASRVTDLQHYPSDIVAGAALGFWIGNGVLRWQQSDAQDRGEGVLSIRRDET